LLIKGVSADTVKIEKVQIHTDGEEKIDNDSNTVGEDSNDTYEEDSLLSVPILHEQKLKTWSEMCDNISSEDESLEMNDINDNNEESNILVDNNEDDNTSEMKDPEIKNNTCEMEEEEEEFVRGKNGVKERFKSMITDGLSYEHWDIEETMCLTANIDEVKKFAEDMIEGISINEDLKLNLQQAIYNAGLKFKLFILNKRNQLVKSTKISIQKLIYLCEKRKKKDEINNDNWTKSEKLE